MDPTGLDVQRNTGVRTTELQLETVEEVSIGQEQATQGQDNILRSLAPLINSMRLFGLYFTRKPRVGPAVTSQRGWQSLGRCRGWNPARIYATVALVVTWINAARWCVVFDGTETLGAAVFMKVVIIPMALLTAVLHTAYFVANITGILHRILRQVNSSKVDFPSKYSRRAKVVTLFCWLIVAWTNIYYIYMIFSGGQFDDHSLVFLLNTFRMSKTHEDVMKVFLAVLQLQAIATSAFTQAMTYIVFSMFTASFC